MDKKVEAAENLSSSKEEEKKLIDEMDKKVEAAEVYRVSITPKLNFDPC
ncbi:12776_t:CDS:2 [Entrophospora sp. SA101]|nr:12776_t:CDS:2 [Entrophospora sp. SA101]